MFLVRDNFIGRKYQIMKFGGLGMFVLMVLIGIIALYTSVRTGNK
jgi:hypothetical protein